MARTSKSFSILLVDADPEASGATEAALGRDFTLIVASSASAGLGLLRTKKPSVVLAARTLPDGDGLDFIAEAFALAPRTPIFCVLAAGTAADAVDAFRHGAWDVLFKGGDYRTELAAALERALAKIVPERCREPALLSQVEEVGRRLDESEEQRRMLENVVEKSPAVTFVWENEPDLPVLFVTANVTRLGFGVSDFGPGGIVFADRIPQSDLERFLLAAEKAGQGGEEVVRHGLEGRDGVVRTVETRLWASRDSQGRALRLQGVVLDVSGQTGAEEDFRLSEARFRSLFMHCPVSLWVEDYSAAKAFCDDLVAKGAGDLEDHFAAHPEDLKRCAQLVRVVDVNDEALSVLGATSRKQLLGPLGAIIGEENYPGFAERMAALAAGETHIEGRALHRLLDGRVMQSLVHVAVPEGYEQKLECVIVAVLDMSAQTKLDDAHERHSRFLERILEAIPDPVYVKDREHRYILANEAMCAMAHTPREKLMGMTNRDVLPPEEAALTWAVDEKVFQTLTPTVQNTPLTPLDGKERHLSIKKMAVELPDTGELVLVGVIRDLTEMRRLEVELTEARDRAEDASRAKSEFLANMSHELRTPMNAIIGMSELAIEAAGGEEREYLRVIRDSARVLLHLLNEILDLSKIEAHRLEVEHRDFSPGAVVRGVVEGLFPEAHRKGININLEVDQATPLSVSGDRVRLRQILVNLVGNAVKFTEQGGVSVRVEPVGEPGPEGVLLQFEVEDTGIGIPEEKLGDVFESFTQADGSITRRYGGTGLGLAISRRLAGLMGGEIEVESTVGRGSLFRLTVVFSAASGEPEESVVDSETLAADLAEMGSLNVLVAEDNPVNQHMIQSWLKQQGHFPIVADNGARVLELLKEHCADVVFMDVQMPVMDGLETTRAIRAADPSSMDPSVPIIAMSAHAMSGDRERFLAAGMDDYVSKPVDFKLVRMVMARVLHNRMRCAARLPEQGEAAAASPVPPAAPSAVPSGTPAKAGKATFAREAALERLGGDEEFLAELIEVFVGDMPQKLEALGKAVASGTPEEVRETSHSIKGAAAAVGASDVANLANRIEKSSATAGRDRLADDLKRLEEAFRLVVPVLH